MMESAAVRFDTFSDNYDQASLAISQRTAVLLMGTVGSGKTTVALELAARAGHAADMIQINMDDSIDSKDLLGKFVGTDVPGAFQWSSGPLATAVEEGLWLLLEDIDLATFDVWSTLLPLLDHGELFIAERNCAVRAHKNFKLLATAQTVCSVDGSRVSARKAGNSIPQVELWATVIVKTPLPAEVEAVIAHMYPAVPSDVVRSMLAENVALRDVIKWANRVAQRCPVAAGAVYISSSQREAMLREG